MKIRKNGSVTLRYFFLTVVLVLCMVVGMNSGIPFFSQAESVEEKIQSDYAQATITVDGEKPEKGQFKFELLDELLPAGKQVIDTAFNDASGKVEFKQVDLSKRGSKNYKIRLLENDGDIDYGIKEKYVNVSQQEVEVPVDPYDGKEAFYARVGWDYGYNKQVIKVYDNNKFKGEPILPFCINTDVALKENKELKVYKDPDDETLSRLIIQQVFDWKAAYDKGALFDSYTGSVYLGGNKFVEYTTPYPEPGTNVREVLKELFGKDKSISEVLKKTLYYVNEKLEQDIQRLNEEKEVPNNYVKELNNRYMLKQYLVWTAVGGTLGTMRKHKRRYGNAVSTFPTPAPEDFLKALQKIINNPKFDPPENYHIMIFTDQAITSQPVAFGYFVDKNKTKTVKKNFINVPKFEVRTKRTIKVTKKWVGATGSSVTVRLIGDGKEVETANLSDSTGWSTEFTVDKVNDKNQQIDYTVTEDPVEGFEKGAITGDQDTGFIITNKKIPEPKDNKIKVTKTWIGIEGDAITITLKDEKTGTIIDTILVTKGSIGLIRKENDPKPNMITWEIPLESDKFNNTQEDITYTAEEAKLDGYQSKVVVDNDGIKITNTETIKLDITKKWIRNPGDKIKLYIKGNDAQVDELEVTSSEAITLRETVSKTPVSEESTENETTWKFSREYPKYDEDGKEITYTVTESAITGYTAKLEGDQEKGFTITNIEAVPIKVTKKWVGKVGEEIIVYFKNGEQTVEKKTVTKAAVVSGSATTWAISADLPKYDEKGNEITYKVDEKAVQGYTKSISGDMKSGFTITNEETPPTPNTPPSIPNTPPTPNIPPSTPNTPPSPNTPPTPTPNIPSIPIDPDPTPRDVPKFPKNNKPDPNKPGSPDEFITVDDDGTPKGRYVKRKQPNGKNIYIEVDLDKTPKGVTTKKYLPRTGGKDNMVYYVGGFAMLMLAGAVIFRRRKEQDAN